MTRTFLKCGCPCLVNVHAGWVVEVGSRFPVYIYAGCVVVGSRCPVGVGPERAAEVGYRCPVCVHADRVVEVGCCCLVNIYADQVVEVVCHCPVNANAERVEEVDC